MTIGMRRLALALLGLLLGPISASTAWAGCTVPFTITTTGTPQGNAKYVACNGEWFRESDFHALLPGQTRQRFYCADQSIFSMWGGWECGIYHEVNGEEIDFVEFCLESTGPSQVNLNWNWQDITVNAKGGCEQAAAAGFLGDVVSTGGAGPASDSDLFDFAGKSGERLRVSLARDGTTGGAGEVATLEARTHAGAVLASRTAKLPVALDVALNGSDLVLAVREAGSDKGEPFRGGYVLSVRPVAGKAGDRPLRPRRSVEP